MSNFFKSSIGKKVIMSVTGLFLILFLCVHLTANAMLLFGSEAYNTAVEFMGENPMIKIMEPVLAAGFLFHIIYSLILSIQNMKARPVRYAVVNDSNNSSWASRNMLILGTAMGAFIAVHMMNFFIKMKFGEIPTVMVEGKEMEDAYTLVSACFKTWYYVLIYIVGSVALALHVSHGFQSGFQSIGMNNLVWKKRLKCIGYFFSILFGVGFSLIAIIAFLQ